MRFLPYFAAATLLALAVTAGVAVWVGDLTAIVLAFGLVPIAWSIALSTYEIRTGRSVAASTFRSLPLFVIGIIFCLYYLAFAAGWVGD